MMTAFLHKTRIRWVHYRAIRYRRQVRAKQNPKERSRRWERMQESMRQMLPRILAFLRIPCRILILILLPLLEAMRKTSLPECDAS